MRSRRPHHHGPQQRRAQAPHGCLPPPRSTLGLRQGAPRSLLALAGTGSRQGLNDIAAGRHGRPVGRRFSCAPRPLPGASSTRHRAVRSGPFRRAQQLLPSFSAGRRPNRPAGTMVRRPDWPAGNTARWPMGRMVSNRLAGRPGWPIWARASWLGGPSVVWMVWGH